MAKQTKVAANLAQNYTPAEQAQARQNIGLATVAHTGDFNDLVNRPESINGQIQSNWTQDNVTAGDYIRNKPVIHTYTAGDNVSISNDDVISAVDTKYTAGTGLTLNGTEFSADTTVLQEKLTAGSNVQIADNVISATDTKYTAGTNVQINSSNVISATDTTYSAGSGLTLTGTTFAADKSVMQEKLTAGTNVQINDNVISATDTKYTAGTNISINSSNVISATDTTYTAGTNVQISNANVISATDTTYSAGSGITLTGTTFSADKSVMQEKLTAGTNVQINDNVISATDTTYSAGSNISIDANNVISATGQVNADWDATSGVAEILNKPETKYWYFDLNGVETTTWGSIGPTSSGASEYLPIQWDDQGTLGRVQVHTNFTSGDPEAFPISTGSSWIVLKKGLWRYTIYVDLEPTTLGTGVTDMSMWVRLNREGVANYITVRRISMPINNGVQSKYTRTLTGLLYIDADPTYSGSELATYRSIRFDVDITGACDAVYQFRQNSLMLERIGV